MSGPRSALPSRRGARRKGDRLAILAFVLVLGIVLFAAGSAAADPSQDISVANAISNVGVIVGGSCTPGCAGFPATELDRNGWRSLGTLGGFAALGYAINDGGVIVGQADTAGIDVDGQSFVSVPFLADRRGMRALPTLQGYADGQAFGVNNRGDVVGWNYNLDPDTGNNLPDFHAFLYRDGSVIDLGTLGGASALARAVADDGRVVGRSRNAADLTRAFVWSHGRMTELASLGGNFAEADGLNPRGDVVGWANAPGGPRHAVMWPKKGSVADLGTLGGSTSRAWAINARGDIVGQADLPDGSSHAFLYRNGVMHDHGTLGGQDSVALAINDRGDVVGSSDTAVPGVSHGFVLTRNGSMRDLGTLSP